MPPEIITQGGQAMAVFREGKRDGLVAVGGTNATGRNVFTRRRTLKLSPHLNTKGTLKMLINLESARDVDLCLEVLRIEQETGISLNDCGWGRPEPVNPERARLHQLADKGAKIVCGWQSKPPSKRALVALSV
jgi:hypothetical protein